MTALEKTLNENRDIEDKRDEGEKIILNSMTRKIDQLEQKLENIHHEQVYSIIAPMPLPCCYRLTDV